MIHQGHRHVFQKDIQLSLTGLQINSFSGTLTDCHAQCPKDLFKIDNDQCPIKVCKNHENVLKTLSSSKFAASW